MGFRLLLLVFAFALPIARAEQPALIGRGLTRASYVSFKAYPLTQARLLYVNDEYLRELGYDVPPRDSPLRPAFDEALLRAHAYGVPRKGEKAYFDLKRPETFYSDRYGGHGMGGNFGSGRAMTCGKYQYKGNLCSPLVGYPRKGSHKGGKLSANEAFRDVTFGEIFDRLTPHGASRVAIVYSTGIPLEDGSLGASVVRIEELRPAHSMKAYGIGLPMLTEGKRVRAAAANVLKGLPLADPALLEGLDEAQAIQRALTEYAGRVGSQYGSAIGKRLFHGATSHSNFLVNGKFVDFATATTLPDHAPAKVLSHVDPFGVTEEIERFLIRDFAESIAANHPAKPILLVEPLVTRFREDYRLTLAKEMLESAGLPLELSVEIASRKTGRDLADLLFRISADGILDVPVNVNKKVAKRHARYSLQQVVELIWKDGPIDDPLKGALSHPAWRDELLRLRQPFLDEVYALAKQKGVPLAEMKKFAQAAIPIRNAAIEELTRDEMQAAYEEYDRLHGKAPDQTAFEKLVNNKIETASRLQSLSIRKTPVPSCLPGFQKGLRELFL